VSDIDKLQQLGRELAELLAKYGETDDDEITAKIGDMKVTVKADD